MAQASFSFTRYEAQYVVARTCALTGTTSSGSVLCIKPLYPAEGSLAARSSKKKQKQELQTQRSSAYNKGGELTNSLTESVKASSNLHVVELQSKCKKNGP